MQKGWEPLFCQRGNVLNDYCYVSQFHCNNMKHNVISWGFNLFRPHVMWSSSWSGFIVSSFHAVCPGWKHSPGPLRLSVFFLLVHIWPFPKQESRPKSQKKNHNWDQNPTGSVEHLWITNIVFKFVAPFSAETQIKAIQASVFLILVSVFWYSADLVWLCIFINITIIIIVLSCCRGAVFSDLHEPICLMFFFESVKLKPGKLH